jgi:hypothetical protein
VVISAGDKFWSSTNSCLESSLESVISKLFHEANSNG